MNEYERRRRLGADMDDGGDDRDGRMTEVEIEKDLPF